MDKECFTKALLSVLLCPSQAEGFYFTTRGSNDTVKPFQAETLIFGKYIMKYKPTPEGPSSPHPLHIYVLVQLVKVCGRYFKYF